MDDGILADHTRSTGLHDLVYQAGIIVEGGEGNLAFIIFDRLDLVEAMLLAEGGIGIIAQKLEQQFLLHLAGVLAVLLQLPEDLLAVLEAPPIRHLGHGLKIRHLPLGHGVLHFLGHCYSSMVKKSVKPVASNTSMMYSLG